MSVGGITRKIFLARALGRKRRTATIGVQDRSVLCSPRIVLGSDRTKS